MQVRKHVPLERREIGREKERAWKDTERRVDWERGRGTHGKRSSRRRRRKGRGPAVLLYHSALAGVKKE